MRGRGQSLRFVSPSLSLSFPWAIGIYIQKCLPSAPCRGHTALLRGPAQPSGKMDKEACDLNLLVAPLLGGELDPGGGSTWPLGWGTRKGGGALRLGPEG